MSSIRAEAPPLTQESVRNRTKNAIHSAFLCNEPTLVGALPGSGKSFASVQVAKETGQPTTFLTERRTLYDQLGEWADDAGLTWRQIPTFHHDCPTASGDHDTEGEDWKSNIRSLYSRGLSGGVLHSQARHHFGKQLPCQSNGKCPYTAALEYDPEDYDVLIGNFRHLYSDKPTRGRTVVIDELAVDSLAEEYDADQVATGVSEFLKTTPEIPFDNYSDLIESNDRKLREQALSWFNENPEWHFQKSTLVRQGVGHASGALMTYVLLVRENLGNGVESALLPRNVRCCRERETGKLLVFRRPASVQRIGEECEDGEPAGPLAVVALDGTPVVEQWKLLLGPDMQFDQVLSDEEQATFVEETLNIRVIQTNENPKPYSSGEYVTPPSDLALVEAIRDESAHPPVLISSKKAIRAYRERGIDELIPPEDTAHFGNLRGLNTFASRRTAVILGSPHRGDDYIKRWGAFAGETIEPEGRGADRDYGEFGNAVLAGHREFEVLQTILRLGRDGEGATVFVHTCALPEWINATVALPEIRPLAAGMEEVVRAIEQLGSDEWRTAEISEAVEISSRQVRDHLNKLADWGYIDRHGTGRGRRWSDIRIHETGRFGHVQFPETNG